MTSSSFNQALNDWATIFMQLSMAQFSRYARTQGLSLAQMNVLHYLFYQGPSEVMRFCDLMQLSPAGASQMIDRLAQQGLVDRLEDAGDRRVRKVHLTVQGQQLVDDSVQARQQWMESLTEHLNEEQQQQATQVLQMLHDVAAQLELAR
jgi:DNA-binding MarR family transcriptional regulator